MRHINSKRQLGRTSTHRRAMFSNMITSLFAEERIITTKEKGKELKKFSEKMITRAKKNIDESDASSKLHNLREIMRFIKNETVVKKLFEDIAIRFKERKGGYTRLYILGRRDGDAAEMAIVELVDRKPKVKAEKKSEKKDDSKKKEAKKKEEKKTEKK